MRVVSVMVMVVVLSCIWLAVPVRSFAGETKTPVKAAGEKAESAAGVEAGLIDLNLASKEQLLTLPGIGENEAKKIIDGRPYVAKIQLVKKGIITSETFYKIAERTTLDLDAYRAAGRDKAKKSFADDLRKGSKKVKTVKTRSGLVYRDLVVGTGKPAAPGKQVRVHYTGWLEDGTQFDSSRGRSKSFSFVLGKGKVIRGWDEGVLTMKEGGKRRLLVPPALGYGATGKGTIPPDATLIFDIELLEVED